MAGGIAEETPSREQLIHTLYEAAELERNLMCTYLYAAFSLKSEEEGLSAVESEAVGRWRKLIIRVAIEEMGHLVAVWNITASLGGQPRFGRGNFPLDPGYLPAGIVVKLAPFNANVLQHFVHLERPGGSDEPDGEGFVSERLFRRDTGQTGRLRPVPVDYETAGVFYEHLGPLLRVFSPQYGESNAFCGDPGLRNCRPRSWIWVGRNRCCTSRRRCRRSTPLSRRARAHWRLPRTRISKNLRRSAKNTVNSRPQIRTSRQRSLWHPPGAAQAPDAGRQGVAGGCGRGGDGGPRQLLLSAHVAACVLCPRHPPTKSR